MTQTIEVPKDEFTQLVERVETVEEELEAERRAREETEALAEALQKRVTNIKAEFKEYREQNELDKARIRQDITALTEEEDEEDEESESTPSGETVMEQIVSYSEEAVQQHLTANERRARFIAKDITDYAKKAPAGFVITSTTIRKIVKAVEGKRPHTQTVTRIIDFLEDFGEGQITVQKRRGKKRVAFTKELVQRLQANHSRCDGAKTPPRSRSVI